MDATSKADLAKRLFEASEFLGSELARAKSRMDAAERDSANAERYASTNAAIDYGDE